MERGVRRELSWDEIRGFWRLRRELLKASLALRVERRRTSRRIEDSLRLAALAREGFRTYLEVVRVCGRERELRLRRR